MSRARSALALGAALLLCSGSPAPAQPANAPAMAPAPAPDAAHAAVLQALERRTAATDAMALDFWANPELGYQEVRTSGRIIAELRKAGFKVETGVGGAPTAFVATWGASGPTIGLLAEMDALPGESQAASPARTEIPGHVHNQGCGHNLFAAGSVAAAIAVKVWLEQSGTPGRIRLYGTPAEEGGSGKVYMVRAGAFEGVDAVLHWHPAMLNAGGPVTNTAVISAKVRFRGKGSHAASSPERGRSALSAVTAMGHMVDLMRGQMRDGARLSYIITNGGAAPNVIPDFAEAYFYVREADPESLRALFQRVLKTAEGAAIGTETSFDYEVIHATYSLLPNEALARVVDSNLRERLPSLVWSAQDRAFAEAIYKTFDKPWLPMSAAFEAQPFALTHVAGSSDVGDVSWVVPTTGLVTATWAPSTDAHTWQAAAASGAGIGLKGMRLAAEVMALSAVDLYRRPDALAAAKAEFLKRRGPKFTYRALVGDRTPPLDYRAPGAAKPQP